MTNKHGPKHALPTPQQCPESVRHASHRERIATAQADMQALDTLDLATASRADMALAIERLRGGFADLIRMELEHHPEP